MLVPAHSTSYLSYDMAVCVYVKNKQTAYYEPVDSSGDFNLIFSTNLKTYHCGFLPAMVFTKIVVKKGNFYFRVMLATKPNNSRRTMYRGQTSDRAD